MPEAHPIEHDVVPGAVATPGTRADTEPAVEELEQQLAAMFAAARGLLRDRALHIHPELSPAGFTLLSTLVRSGPQHAGSLAAAMLTDKSTVSRLVKQLAELRLVERRPDPADGRACYLAATPHAVRKLKELRDEQRRRLREFLADWEVTDIRQLTALLARLNGLD